MGTELEFTEGMQFDKGYISAYFVSDAERMEAVLDDPYILLHQGKISAVADLPCRCWRRSSPPASRCSSSPRDVDGEALVDAGRQQDPRHLQRGRGEEPGVRRPPQGDDAGHRDPDRWPGRRAPRSAS